ncbi:MAG TPA: baseplate J/gp47 family protein [Ktedonobacteraceae bacterium]|nr:baseplate J/gp47 family protein [Ktedonobacteraceae bacterium]
MRVAVHDGTRDEPQEILHLYVVPESEPGPRPPFLAGAAAVLCLALIVVLAIFSAVPGCEIAFTLTVPGYWLAPIQKSLTVAAKATGQGHLPATTATGSVTFYNGLAYTQIIPVGTVLKGKDGVAVITDAQAVIPPVAETTPPTDGQTSVPAHAASPGASGNIAAGDINMPCCVTSVIAQNPYAFVGGKNAQSFLYVSKHDVSQAAQPLVTKLTAQTASLFPTRRLVALRCASKVVAMPGIGQKATSAQVSVTATCTALTFHLQAVLQAVRGQSARRGSGRISDVNYQVVGVSGKRVSLYITALWHPLLPESRWRGK